MSVRAQTEDALRGDQSGFKKSVADSEEGSDGALAVVEVKEMSDTTTPTVRHRRYLRMDRKQKQATRYLKPL